MATANWQSFEIQVPGKDLLEPVRDVLETLLVYLEILKTLLDTIKTFLVDFGNPIKALVENLLRLIQELLNSLRVSGFFGYFDIPEPAVDDPNFDQFFGGTSAFTQRFKQSLFDGKDMNRPQPRQGSTQSGFILLVVEAETIFGLLALIRQLMRFFGKDFTGPRYAPPANFKALPVGDDGDPILAVASLFSSEIKAIQLSWTLPTNNVTPDDGFRDVVTKVADEFVPPSFLIERADVAPSQPLNVSSGDDDNPVNLSIMHDTNSVGPVEYDMITEFTQFGSMSQRLKVRTPMLDETGEPVIKFQRYTTISGVEIESILGQLGRFRYIDSDVEIGRTYYYRVRAYSGDLDVVNEGTDDSYINWKQAEAPAKNPDSSAWKLVWPSQTSERVTMGGATAILPVTIPKVPPDFDVLDEMRQLLKLAFSLDFHIQVDKEAEFDDAGDPINDTSPIQVGRGTLTNIASTLAAFQAFPIVGAIASLEAAGKSPEPDPVTGQYPEFPWETFQVIRQSSRLALSMSQALLEAGTNAIDGFRQLMLDAFPAGVPSSQFYLTNQTPNVHNMVYFLTRVQDGPGEEDFATESATILARNYSDAYVDLIVRKNVLAVVRYLLSFNGAGIPPDWIAVQPLRDIIPWSGQIIYALLDAIQKLLNAFQGVLDEIKAFIDLLIRKIDAMERFIEFLIQILDFIDSLQVGAYILNASGLSGDAGEWVEVVDTAGNPPPNKPGGYSAGVAFAYVATDVTAFVDAFKVIFG